MNSFCATAFATAFALELCPALRTSTRRPLFTRRPRPGTAETGPCWRPHRTVVVEAFRVVQTKGWNRSESNLPYFQHIYCTYRWESWFMEFSNHQVSHVQRTFLTDAKNTVDVMRLRFDKVQKKCAIQVRFGLPHPSTSRSFVRQESARVRVLPTIST